jgi:cell fate regulator YaaT (PSP1 superfamily)
MAELRDVEDRPDPGDEPVDELVAAAEYTPEGELRVEDELPLEDELPPVVEEDEAATDEAAETGGPIAREAAIGVRFGPGEQAVYYRRGRMNVTPGDLVVAQVDRGMDIGQVTSLPQLPIDQVKKLPTLLRVANERDLERQESLDSKRKEGLTVCRQLIESHNLPMRLIDCHCTLDGRRLVFYFASEARVDFRDLVRDLAREFRCRIELRQVGVRDHARMLGGLGPCGRPLCCAQFLRTFEPVSIRAAKDQGIALNPGKLSGLCDRLMCCLLYEHAVYKELGQNMPKMGSHIQTPNGMGKVEGINLLTHTISLWLEEGRRASFSAKELGYGPACGCGNCGACVRVAAAAEAKATAAVAEDEPEAVAEGAAPVAGDAPTKPKRRRRRRKKSGGEGGGDQAALAPPAS